MGLELKQRLRAASASPRASSGLSLVSQVTGQEEAQRGSLLKARHTDRTGWNQNSGPLPPRPGLCPSSAWRQPGYLRSFLSQTHFFRLLPHDLSIEGTCMYHVQPSSALRIPCEMPLLNHLQSWEAHFRPRQLVPCKLGQSPMAPSEFPLSTDSWSPAFQVPCSGCTLWTGPRASLPPRGV